MSAQSENPPADTAAAAAHLPIDETAAWRRFLFGGGTARRRMLMTFTLATVVVVGLADFLLGFQLSILVFYILPVCLAVSVAGWRFGVLTAAFSVACWLVGDFAAGASFTSPWVPVSNALFALATFLVVVWLLHSVLSLQREMESRVRQRTAALQELIAERARLERALLDAGERERHRIGHDLHDGLGQHFTGTALACQVLADKLAVRALPEEEADARRIVDLVDEGIEKTRQLARGLLLPELPQDALVSALRELATETSLLARADCELRVEGGFELAAGGTATHLFHIAQEAVRNAVRHGRARHIVITLAGRGESRALHIQDDGSGLPPAGTRGAGLGLRIMAHRAEIIGWQFAIAASPAGGTLVSCSTNPC